MFLVSALTCRFRKRTFLSAGYLVLLLLLGGGHSAAAQDISIGSHGYSVFRGHFYRSDGVPDYYFYSRERLLILHGDIATPITIPANPTFVVPGVKAGTHAPWIHGAPVAKSLSDAEVFGLQQLTEGVDYLIGDFDGDGKLDFLIRSLQQPGIEFPHIVYGVNQFTLPSRIYNFSPLDGEVTELISNQSNSFYIRDVNGDGADDLVLRSGNSFIADTAYLSVSDVPKIKSENESGLTVPATKSANLAGKMDAQAGVSASGAATYVIPVKLPQGSGGHTPQLALSYSSQGGNGLMGQGWSVSGLSAIKKCFRTLAQDNLIANTGTKDRFCLDGQRLVADASYNYGDAGAVYRTEIDSFRKITAYGTDGGTPDYFLVESKDGKAAKYVLAGSESYLLKEVTDSSGNNSIRYTYIENDTKGYRIDKIEYAFGTGSTANAYIDFIYEGRPDTIPNNLLIGDDDLKQRLSRIEVFNNSSEFRTYHVNYLKRPASAVGVPISRVSSIQECVGSGCLPAATFKWNISDNPGFNPVAYCEDECNLVSNGTHFRPYGRRVADVNGDGLADYVWLYKTSGGSTFFQVSLSDGEKWVRQPYSVKANSEARSSWHLADYNGDGRLDLVYSTGSGWKVKLFNGSDFAGQEFSLGISDNGASESLFQDVTGNGLPDLIVRASSKKAFNVYYAKSKTSGGFEYGSTPDNVLELPQPSRGCGIDHTGNWTAELGEIYGFRLQDTDGDGATEFTYSVREECNGDFWAYGWGDGNLSTGLYYPYGGQLGANSLKFDFKPADLNRDGKSDMVFKDHEDNWSYFIDYNEIPLPEITGKDLDLVDFNSDGYLDLAWPAGGKLNVKIWNGTGFAPAIVTALDADSGDKHLREFADIDGDGYLEFVRIYDGENEFHMHYNAPLTSGFANNVINSVTNGYGEESIFTYKPFTDDTVYTKGQGAGSLNWGQPVFDITGSVYVVSKHEFSTPTAASPNNKGQVNYKYKGLRVQGGGRGNLGFQEVTKTDSRIGTTKTVFAQEFPYTGMPLRVEKYSPQGKLLYNNQGKLLYKLSNTLKKRAGNGAPYWPYVDAFTEEHRLLKDNGASTGAIYKTVVTDNTYDNFGNLELSVTTTKNASGQTVSTVTQDNCFNCFQAPNWHREYGRVAGTKITTKRGTVSENREVRFEYYPKGNSKFGLLKTEYIEPNYTGTDKDRVQLTTDYTYDDYANRLKTIKSANTAAGGPSRVSESIYDPQKRYINKTKDADGRLLTEVRARNDLGLPTEIRTYLNVSGSSFVTTTVQYDALGRETFRDQDGAPWVKTEYKKCTSCNLPGAVSYTVVTSETGARTTTYFDALGRKLREESLGFDSSDVILVDTEYDNLGRVKRQSEPYPKGSAPQYWTENYYDISSRITSVTLPDGSTVTHSEPVVESSLVVTTTTNPKGQKRTEKKNALGETVFVLDHHDGMVEYKYDPLGNLTDTISHGRPGENLGITISVTYDKRGRKKTLSDPDKGVWFYKYNAFGDLIEQADGKRQKVVTVYDRYGRPLRRTDFLKSGTPEGHTRWYYDDKDAGGKSIPYALGKVTSVIMSERLADEICYADTTHYCGLYEYDSSGRQAGATTILGIGGADGYFHSETVYDGLGRPQIQQDVLNGVVKDGGNSIASGIREHYTNTGQLRYVTDLDTGRELYRVTDTNSRGQVTGFDINSGKVSTRNGYDAATGRLLSQKADKSIGGTVQHMVYTWDDVGNVTSRNNPRTGKKESFCYDHLNRLLQVKAGTTSISGCNPDAVDTQYQYDSIGNIKSKDGVDYLYQGLKPHVVTKVGTVTYTNDNNGNLTSDGTGRSFTYTSFDKPSLIENSGSNDSTAFSYGPDRSRYKRMDSRSNGEVITTLYLGNVERIHKSSDGKYRWKRYLPGGGVFTYTTDTAFNQQSFTELYLLRDHIGSTDVVLDANGNVKESMAFDPWGKRRDTNWQPIEIADLLAGNYSLLDSLTDITTQGFTGHEMVDALGIIHMNGRIYDPELGRFLQADPFIDGVDDTQGYNRYSYVKGNPMTLTDPTGYYSWDDFTDDLKELCGSSCGIRADSNGNVEVFAGQYNPDHEGFWAQPGAGGASTPEGSVPGAFANGSEYLAYILDYVSNNNRANGGGFDAQLSPEVSRLLKAAFNKHGFDDESAYSLVDAGEESGLSLAAAQELAKSEGGDNAQKERTWGSYLPGTEAGDSAAQYWADRVVNSEWHEDPTARAGLFLSVLWTDETAANTAFTLGTAGTGGIWAAGSKYLNGLLARGLVSNPGALRFLPQTGVRGTLDAAGWAFKSVRSSTALRGGWSRTFGKGPDAVLQWSAAGGRHGISYWKLTGSTIHGTTKVPYFRFGSVPK